MKKPAQELKEIPFPECHSQCLLAELMGVSECHLTCPEKENQNESIEDENY